MISSESAVCALLEYHLNMNPIVKSHDWLHTPKGQYVLACEQAWCDHVLDDVFGYHALQLGMVNLQSMRNNRIPHQWTAELKNWNTPYKVSVPSASSNAVVSNQLVVSASYLPFPSETLDLMVLPHALELAEDPHGCLREVSRVLRPQGQVLVLGFQSWSLWGVAWYLWHRYAKEAMAPILSDAQTNEVWPYRVSWISRKRLKDWLQLLDFEIVEERSGVHRPPLDRWLRQLPSIERFHPTLVSSSFERWTGAIYMIRAVKRVPGVRWVSPAWKNAATRPVAATTRMGAQKDLREDRT